MTTDERTPQMVNLNPAQAALLDTFEKRADAYHDARATLEARLRKELERQLLTLRTDASLAGNRAVAAGVPKTRLAIGVRSKHFGTIAAFLAETATNEAAEPATPDAERFEFDSQTQTLTVRLIDADRDVFEQARQAGMFGWTWPGSPNADYAVAQFRVSHGGRMEPITAPWDEHMGDAHPVVALYTRNPQMEAAAIEWARSRPGFNEQEEAA
jgi:hypothetical protein